MSSSRDPRGRVGQQPIEKPQVRPVFGMDNVCRYCKGKGHIPKKKEICGACRGTGVYREERNERS